MTKFILYLLFLECHSDYQDIGSVVQLSPRSKPRTFHHVKKKLVSKKRSYQYSHLPSLPCPNLPVQFVSMDLPILDILFHINGSVQYVAFSVWLILLNMFFRVLPCCSMYQYFIPVRQNNIPLFVYATVFLCIHQLMQSLVDGHLDCFVF